MTWISALLNRTTIPRRGLDHLLDYGEIRSVQQVILYSAPFLDEPAAWCVSLLTYPAETSSWFLTPPSFSQQALVISAPHDRWHIVPVPKPPLVEAIVRDILLKLSPLDGCAPMSKKIIIHEHPGARDTMQRCRFEVHGVEYRVWHVGLYENSDGPLFLILPKYERAKGQRDNLRVPWE